MDEKRVNQDLRARGNIGSLEITHHYHYSSSMKLFWSTALLFALAGAPCRAKQANTSNPTANEMIVRVLNGKNGKPIKNEVLAVLLGNGPQKNYRTDRNGEVSLSIAQHPATRNSGMAN